MTSQPAKTPLQKTITGPTADHQLQEFIPLMIQHPYSAILNTVPNELQYLLKHPDVDYNSRKTTIGNLRSMMVWFNFKVELPSHARKAKIVDYYLKQFLPELLKVLPPVQDRPSNAATNDDRATAGGDTRMGDATATYINPNAKTSTKSVLFDLILPRMKPQMILPTFCRPDMIKLFYKFVDTTLNKPAPTSNPEFVRRPRVEKLEDLVGSDCDMIRHAIQCYAPNVFIPMGMCDVPILLKLYALFVQGNDNAANDLCEGVHYHVIDPNQLKPFEDTVAY
ncbi:uncharacterized protein MELLADRAFT_87850 [Melampsora larici-populina 98AG31]|uniref:Uncharacterized protein n=1 Tax=Melampsora larici-populina (strain 98AG31 / pathotype 3-4-7) TaxID=747676 RepID=F4RPQ0_MELLP|nr:uncharacterized protein MELLADRAFT_87850 [Melampsora larici-populina 98AG31]EGG05579.1 hypothetical protein MELLADRAFT_87850 [Melampsora larici-populina 98AG31]